MTLRHLVALLLFVSAVYCGIVGIALWAESGSGDYGRLAALILCLYAPVGLAISGDMFMKERKRWQSIGEADAPHALRATLFFGSMGAAVVGVVCIAVLVRAFLSGKVATPLGSAIGIRDVGHTMFYFHLALFGGLALYLLSRAWKVLKDYRAPPRRR